MLSSSYIPCLTAALLMTACLPFLSATTNAQSTAAIKGEVSDQNNAVIPEGEIIVRSETIGFDRTVTADTASAQADVAHSTLKGKVTDQF